MNCISVLKLNNASDLFKIKLNVILIDPFILFSSGKVIRQGQVRSWNIILIQKFGVEPIQVNYQIIIYF